MKNLDEQEEPCFSAGDLLLNKKWNTPAEACVALDASEPTRAAERVLLKSTMKTRVLNARGKITYVFNSCTSLVQNVSDFLIPQNQDIIVKTRQININITQSNRQLTREERALVNCMVHEERCNSEINRALAAHQNECDLPLRLLSSGYLDRIRTQFNLFNRVRRDHAHDPDGDRARGAVYGIQMLEAGYSWSGSDARQVAHHITSRAVDKLSQIYLDPYGEATR